MTCRTAVILICAPLALTACDPLRLMTVPDWRADVARGTVEVMTDAASYRLEPEWVGAGANVTLRVENRTSSRLYLIGCRGAPVVELQRNVGADEWEPYWRPVEPLCGRAPAAVDPGNVVTESVRLWAALSTAAGAYPVWPEAELDGTYRFVVTNLFGGRGGPEELLPEAARTSNEFTLRR